MKTVKCGVCVKRDAVNLIEVWVGPETKAVRAWVCQEHTPKDAKIIQTSRQGFVLPEWKPNYGGAR